MGYQSPISPGISWYEATLDARPEFPPLDGSRRADVVVIGGGFTGLSAAVHLAKAGIDVVLVEAHRLGDGASGRNGGQLGTGQRAWAEDLEAQLGFTRAKALFDVAEEAKSHLLSFASENGIDIDYAPDQLSVAHKARLTRTYQAHADIMRERFGYPHLTYMDREETAERLGSTRYFGGIRDTGTGHVHPFKLLVGTARVAAASGAHIFEQTKALRIAANGNTIEVVTDRGIITAANGLIATNAHIDGLEDQTARYLMPIGSFIGATPPLGADSAILPGGESVDDSRFVVRYFRKSRDGRLLFGGREVYSKASPANIRIQIRRQIAEVYPQLKDVDITHAWGGYVGITMSRMPFVREVMPRVLSIGGYSGHGVMLSNFMGRLYADALAGNREKLKLFEDLVIPPFPGGKRFQSALLLLALNWYALRDRL